MCIYICLYMYIYVTDELNERNATSSFDIKVERKEQHFEAFMANAVLAWLLISFWFALLWLESGQTEKQAGK